MKIFQIYVCLFYYSGNSFHMYFSITCSIGKWLVPPSPPKPRTISQILKDSLPPQFSMMYWRNNRQFVGFLFFLISVNIILFVHRAYYFMDFATLEGTTPNGFYMMSRANGGQNISLYDNIIEELLRSHHYRNKITQTFACFILGRTLLFNSTVILVLVLRYSITKLRELGLAFILPLDNNIYLHKVVGWIIFGQALFHTVMHLCNFGKYELLHE